MADMKNMKNKTTKNNMINYGIVIVLFVIVQALSSTGNLSRLLMGLLVPLCVYTIASVSLNLVVGFSGELSLGHAGFMCVGAFSSALFSQVAADSIPQVPRFILAILVGAAVAALFGVIIGTYSTLYVAKNIVLWLGVKRDWSKPDPKDKVDEIPAAFRDAP